MSASPAERTPGQTPGRTPNGGLQPRMRRPKPADPMVRPKDKKLRSQRPSAPNGAGPPRSNGQRLLNPGQPQVMPQHPGRPIPHPTRPISALPDGPDPVSGFTSAAIAKYTDYPLVVTKQSLLKDLHHHVARFASKKVVDPRNAEEFVRPVRLQRRDPRAPPAGGGVKNEDTNMAEADPKAVIDEQERERQELIRAERDALREAEMAQVAPSVNSGGQKKINASKKKTQQIFRNDQTEEQKASSKLRYEEALPWHLEDFEGKNIWVGSYEAALSETYAMLIQGPDGTFRMVPVNKWYKFTSKNQFKTLTIEEAENQMGKKVKDSRWFMQYKLEAQEKKNEEQNKKATRGLFLGKWENSADSGPAGPRVKQDQADADDLDFQQDQFADDEVDVVVEGEDEDTREAEARIKRDQLQANIFDLKEEREYDEAEEAERKEKDRERKLGKVVRKALKKREKNYIYDSDSGDHPYSEESESDDTETERMKEEERKKEKDKKPVISDVEKANPSKQSSGASSKGTNTPQRRGKTSAPPKKPPTTNALKRPGSPNLSEASGAESSRKKSKRQHTPAPAQSQPLNPISRPLSPVQQPSSSAPEQGAARPASNASRKPSNTRLTADTTIKGTRSPNGSRSHAGSGSENEAAGSGAEKSDGTRQRLKLKFGKKGGGQNGSTTVSRAGSPEVRGADNTARAGQAAASEAAASSLDPATAPFPTAAELRACIPPAGIKVGELLGHFPGQVVGEERKSRFTRLMRENTRYDKPTKTLYPL
ncbi:hypothetical protein MMC07_004931 [Pseudocyphellaria aurata]|nr:hypothetical protein [Pseudocyphellaria aurata]